MSSLFSQDVPFCEIIPDHHQQRRQDLIDHIHGHREGKDRDDRLILAEQHAEQEHHALVQPKPRRARQEKA